MKVGENEAIIIGFEMPKTLWLGIVSDIRTKIQATPHALLYPVN
jgi:hypothetical protein